MSKTCPTPPPFPRPDAPALKFSGWTGRTTELGAPPPTFLSDAGQVDIASINLAGPLRYPVPAGRYRHLGATLLRSIAAGEDVTLTLVRNGSPVTGASVTFTGPVTAPATLRAAFAPVDYDGSNDTLDVQTSSTRLADNVLVSATVSGSV